MDTSRVAILNVNPAEATLGSLHPEAAINRLRRRVDIEGDNIARRKSGALLRALFGATSTPSTASLLLLGARILGSLGMAWIAYDAFIDSNLWLAIVSATLTVVLFLGTATRFCLTASAALFGILSGLALDAGQVPVLYGFIAVSCALLAYAGPGRYSIDAILKRKIFRSIRRYETHKLMERRFSYKAYQYSHIV
ncbi:MAG: hypothetical protein K2M31_03570 [Muribaculaceae bacterium]|nr:hypothetical protein [Muribaculaceae bacterium]